VTATLQYYSPDANTAVPAVK